MAGIGLRPAAVAGTFYPAGSEELCALVDGLLARAVRGPADPAPRGLIAPHAGFVYSGPVAASAYAAVEPLRGRVRRVVVLGPAHYLAVPGIALPSARGFASPLGAVPIDHAAMTLLRDLPGVQVLDAAHLREHSIEVQLPFLQRALGNFNLVPLLVGDAAAEEVADVIERLWDEHTLVVVSSDLSHYHDYETARALDEGTARAIEGLDAAAIPDRAACGARPLRGFLVAARRRGLSIRRLDLRNSADTCGGRDRVVGYGAWQAG
jgi:AmmeMemoRadiSam system protein B